MSKLQTVYIPTNGDSDLAICQFNLGEWGHLNTVKEIETFIFTPEELKKLLKNYTDRIIKNIQIIDTGLIGEEGWESYMEVDEKSITSQLSKFLKEL
jgi:Icc-related predicted phosphoesterase